MEHARAIKDPPPSISEVNDIDSSHHGDQYSEEGSSYHGDDGFDGAAATAPQRSLLLGAKTASKAFKKDQKLVRGARVTVMLVLLTSAVTVATLAYVLLSMNEEKSFQDQFKSSAEQVLLMANRNAANVFVSFATFASVIPSHAQESGRERMPFVTIDQFVSLGAGFCNVSKASYIHYSPLLSSAAELQAWSNYSVTNAHRWIDHGRQNCRYNQNGQNDTTVSDAFLPFVFSIPMTNGDVGGAGGPPQPVTGNGPFAPAWMMSPVPPDVRNINVDVLSFDFTKATLSYTIETGRPSLSGQAPGLREFHDLTVQGPISFLYQPVFDNVPKDEDDDDAGVSSSSRKVVGFLTGMLGWQFFFDNTLPAGHQEVVVVVKSCNAQTTFIINGSKADFVNDGDHHDPKYNGMEKWQTFVESDVEDPVQREKLCQHSVHVYPSSTMEADYRTQVPLVYAMVTLAIFAFAALVFLLYDYFVTSRQSRTEHQADQSNAIVQELFPGDVAARLFQGDSRCSGRNNDEDDDQQQPAAAYLNGILQKSERSTIAELYPEATVLFADISGFTAWSSIRDPNQVFLLLESIFQAFDAIAKRHRVFKVETIGDCYVAACGVPYAHEEHAAVMCRFARRIMVKFQWVCRNLELSLGPDTGDLALRVGLHSGPVTAGVLRGERARFQLFGDTVNTASRLESTGKRDRIHVSEQTAAQLAKYGKGHWVVLRDDVVEAKGKGKLITYWLKLVGHGGTHGSTASFTNSNTATCSDLGDDADIIQTSKTDDEREWNVELPALQSNETDYRNDRLVHWNCELLLELLQRVVSRRNSTALPGSSAPSPKRLTNLARSIGSGSTVVEEVVEVIDMPDFAGPVNHQVTALDAVVVDQLRDYVAKIASLYNDNPFHNFEHASHVTMSVHKLLGRIVAPSQLDLLGACSNADQQAAVLHDHTCGITSDPLTQFAVVLSALIHDLDHPGVSNGQLIKEDHEMALRYKEKNVAEQNSVDLAWNELMTSDYDQLRTAIFANETELYRFRNLLVNSIIATDIFDKDLGTLRKNRWNKAFYETTPEDDTQEVKSRKATIVIEHLIQASDVAHTMQHWHVYQKWNQRLFNEIMMAYSDGRSDKDPSEGWFGGELWFFDNYVIPLAKNLKDCGVFGVSSDEYLNYAQHNRNEWEAKGMDVVAQYRDEFNQKHRETTDVCVAVASTESPNLVTL